MKNVCGTRRGMMLLLALILLLGTIPVQAEAPKGPVTVTVQVKISTEGTPPETPEAYRVVLEANEAGAPMPGGAAGSSYTLIQNGPGETAFPVIEYDQLGIYTYTIRQLPGTDPNALSYDGTVYSLKVTVYRNEDTNELLVAVALRLEDGADKLDGCAFVNVYADELIDVTVAKVWDDADDQDGVRSESLKVTLSNGDSVTLNEENGWTATVKDLPRFEKNTRNPITYTWTEETVTGYTLTDTKVEEYTTTFTNAYTPKTTSMTVKKTWADEGDQDGVRPESVTVTLLANGAAVGTVTLNEANGWSGSIADLPVNEAGKAIEYTWSEPEVAGYTLTDTAVEDNATTLTNTHEPETTELTVVKVWKDETNPAARPAKIVMTLSGNGETWEVELSEANKWTATVTDLPKNADGKPIEYTWSEPEIAGYTQTSKETAGATTTFTNTLTETPPVKYPEWGPVYINVGDCLE